MVNDAGSRSFLVFKPNSRQIMMAVAATTVVIGGIQGYRFLQLPSPASEAVTTSLVKPQIKTVTALGRIEPQGEVIKLSAPASSQSSRVEKLLVKEGDKVKAGQVIAILDNRDRLQAAWQESQEAVNLAQVNLEKVKAGAKIGEIQAQTAEIARVKAQTLGEEGQQREAVARLEAQWEGEKTAQQAAIRKLEAELKNAQIEFQRYQQLYQEGATSKSLFDSKQLSVDTITQQLQEANATLKRIDRTGSKQVEEAKTVLARINATGSKQIKSAQATLNQIAEVRPVDVAAAQGEVKRALAAAKQAKANLDQAYVRSPQDGIVFDIHTRSGEMVSSDGIVEIGQTNQMYVVVEVYQSDISKIKPGQTVKISSNSLPSDLHGKVDWVGWKIQRQNIINSDPSENIDSRVVEVHVGLDKASSEKAAKFTNLQVKAVIQL
ncbi:heterocyst specific ABC-transporter, membrane fusion protein DevB [Richelia sinica FACHB-800]|uniref:Heterocyst specific ABC-transporter, membrane fusion protein DevB n=1 Tax=Richelia sinica FACHB-800 TaxID=1357546 RepID=A0A975Y602_9NOST|nr:ABC exporter membrane fusion protein [Richelia sinica]MBD2666976.1 ABC exporter membrane fusion protein [Richelia sinica FACHB-800]QXE24766.1 heterocyst specific ABC-transporter, membrane fusion protein DevB [Richelia sinica FACHB-800]